MWPFFVDDITYKLDQWCACLVCVAGCPVSHCHVPLMCWPQAPTLVCRLASGWVLPSNSQVTSIHLEVAYFFYCVYLPWSAGLHQGEFCPSTSSQQQSFEKQPMQCSQSQDWYLSCHTYCWCLRIMSVSILSRFFTEREKSYGIFLENWSQRAHHQLYAIVTVQEWTSRNIWNFHDLERLPASTKSQGNTPSIAWRRKM